MKQQIDYIISQLRGYYPDEELRELAYWIVEETTGITRTEILIGCKDTKNIPNLEIILQKLRAHVPVQYIFGHTEWMGLDLRVTPATLIPRPETAELVEWILQSVSSNMGVHVLDIGTGSGCIAIALKHRAPQWQVTGIDISSKALEVARDNAQRNGVEVEWKQADVLSNSASGLILTDGPTSNSASDLIHIIVSNPPYICEKEKRDMDARVLDYEPHSALFVPDNDPLLFYRRIVSLPLVYRFSPYYLFFEINEAYGNEVCEMMRGMGYTDVELKYDMYGKPRMVSGRIAR
ncbi:MAG: peptide chain release factor N(5)-glutamine methyltransferase [Paludibacteraceae bacterium]|nr:peptide chain release factor N(5)-glutamine methyltransferase [Paludibacteraceae bacterium]